MEELTALAVAARRELEYRHSRLTALHDVLESAVRSAEPTVSHGDWRGPARWAFDEASDRLTANVAEAAHSIDRAARVAAASLVYLATRGG